MKRVYCYLFLIFCIVVIVIIGCMCWYCKPTTIIIVRHAEKADTPLSDPPLTAEGIERARSLSHVLEDAGIDAIIATEYQRTQATVQPTANNLGLNITIVPSADLDQLIDSINDYRGKEVLIAGHSNSIPEILNALGIDMPLVIAENAYDNLFIVHKHTFIFRLSEMTLLKYGMPSP